MAFSIIPVLDVRNGRAVHAVGGLRDSYQPLRTILNKGSRPLDAARAYRDRLELTSIYLADLDAIAGDPPHFELYERLAAEGFELLLDAGLTTYSSAERFHNLPSARLVVGLETIQGPREARAILDRAGPERAVFSLDQFNGRPLTASPTAWRTADPAEIAEQAADLGYAQFILLDLARVGTGRGPDAGDLLHRLRRANQTRRILVGGGVSSAADVLRLKNDGASGVLLGSVLHDGRVGLSELRSLMVDSPGGARQRQLPD